MAIVTVEEIHTVSKLYELNELEFPGVDDEVERGPQSSSAPSFNDRICVFRGDITKLEVGAIVNAANNSLLGGGGVDGAIHRAAGPDLLKECRTLRGCETGSAKITDAYDLPCKKVIHAVGPIFDSRYEDECAEDLAGCYTTALSLAAENGCKSIAFSTLSTGIYGYPSKRAASVAIKAVKEFLLSEDGDKLEHVIFCLFVPKDVDAYGKWLPNFFPPPEEETDWEKIEGGETAENGPASQKDETMKHVENEGEEAGGVEKSRDGVEELNIGRIYSEEEVKEALKIRKETMDAEIVEKEATLKGMSEEVADLRNVSFVEPKSEPAVEGPATKKLKSGDE